MASSTLAMPASYHQSPPSLVQSKMETKKVRSEDELLKFFLHGSYDVQRGESHSSSTTEETNEKQMSLRDETIPLNNINSDEQKPKSRCMFEETFMINISVKQPDTKPSSKQIDVRIEKSLSDPPISNEKMDDDDEISSIFDEEDNDEVDSVIFNEINSTSSETPPTKLTLGDMINKTLTTIPAISMDNLNQISRTNSWYVEQPNEIKRRKTSGDILSSKHVPTPSPPSIPKATLTTTIREDEKLFQYLDYLETKEESKQTSKSSSTTKNPKLISSTGSKIPTKQEPISIIDLEQLCRSLTVNDLKDELIRKKIFELKILIDEQHKKSQSQPPLIKPRKDTLPILIAMPPVIQQRRRTTNPPSTNNHPPIPYNSNYQEIISNYNSKQTFFQRQIPPNRKYHYT